MMRWRPGAVAAAARGGVARRRATTVVIGVVVLVSTAACTLALGLVVDSRSPFDAAFAAQRGAHLAVTVDKSRATPAQLAATGRLPGVTALSGPFSEVTVSPVIGGGPGGPGYSAPPITLVGRPSPGGPLDHLTLIHGRWPHRRGEFVLSSDSGLGLELGAHIAASGVPGSPVLTLVGVANSVGQTADGWVLPAEVPALRAPGSLPTAQLLYRFAAAGSAAALKADARSVASALPARTVLASQSYLAVKQQVDTGIAPIVPFVVAFGLIGLVLSVLIVVNVVSGAVVAGYRRIGVLKSIGFTPAQVVATYASQITVPALVGCLVGVVLGNVLAVPLLGRTASVYQVGALAVPPWVDLAVPVAMCCLAGLAAIAPAIRAGRLSAVQAIATGRAPLQGRGYAAHRLLARLRLPRPVTIGLAAPFARPARTAVTLTAVLLGATTVTFAAGLTGSLNRVVVGQSHSQAEPVQAYLPSGNTGGPANFGPGGAPRALPVAVAERTTEAALRAQPGTLRYVAEADERVSVVGLTGQVDLTAFRGDARWTGYDLISGRWYNRAGEAVVPTNFLTVTGTSVGDTVTISDAGGLIAVRIVGEIFDTSNQGLDMLTDWRTVATADPRLVPATYDVGLRPGTDPQRYARALGHALGSGSAVSLNTNDPFFLTLTALIALLTVLLAVVAGLGVLNTVLLHSRERVHDLGIFRAVGMTPRQTIVMVVCWVAGPGLAAGLVAVPAGMAVHRYVLPVMAHAGATNLPASYIAVYSGPELALLALAGLVIAVAGALLPAGWAARSAAATALRAE
ncbi:MAG TPA: FtsX-like permease family protein [Streptosporangiaceae bacterium]|nr:FtsX-like permease family protein [Streptosporangiaceae bacterium]